MLRSPSFSTPASSSQDGDASTAIHRAARPRKAKKPTTSVKVVTNVPDATAGSMSKWSSVSGTRIPARAAAKRLMTRAAAMTRPSTSEPNQAQAKSPMITAKSSPLIRPTAHSRSEKRSAFTGLMVRVASARTATVMVCVAALPPIEATMGMRMASTTICSIVASQNEITHEARTAVSSFTKSQAKRERVVSITVVASVSSAPTPPRCSNCSAASCWMTSTMSPALSASAMRATKPGSITP